MKVDQRQESDVAILTPQGRIDAAGMNDFSAALNTAIQMGNKKILIDFSQADYMSSAGIRVLIETKKKVEAEKGEIAFCSVNEQLLELFEVVRIDKVFHIYPTEFAALDKMIS